MTNLSTLSSGMVGFMIASIKTLDSAPVGDTIVLAKDENALPLAGFKKIQPRVILDSILSIQMTIKNQKKH